jgi:hypothetical protein
MDILDEEILAIWKKFHETGLEYIMVGGFATNLHGYQRTTGDLDIWIKDSPENRKKLRTALSELGLGDFDAIERMEFIPGWSTIRLFSGLELDIMTYLKGFRQESFDECFRISPIAEIEQVPIRFLHINHLIEEKKKLAREKDLLDVVALEKIKSLQNSPK